LLEELLRQLDKTVRARQLYMANNPTYQRALDNLRNSFAPVWNETDAFTLSVTDTQFRWSGVVVHEQGEKASDSLPWLFYKDGLREITLTRGFEAGELEQLIDIIPRVRRAQAGEDDLITILWEHEFTCLSYRHVDLGHDGATVPGLAAEPGRYPTTRVGTESPVVASAQARGEVAANPEILTQRPSVVKLEDFDSTLYFLDEKEIEYIRREVGREYASDLRRTVVESLLDILELQADPAVRSEVLGLLDQMVLHLLSAARFQTVAYLLRESAVVLERAKDLLPEHRARLLALPSRLSHPETLSQILQQLDEAAELPAQEDLSALFAELQPTSLETIFEWLGRMQNQKLRPLLESAADRLAGANTTELVRILGHAEGFALLEAVRRAGALKTGAAVAPLGKVLTATDRELRLAAVQALVTIGSAGAMQTLERALADADRDVRITAVRALGARNHRAALPRVEAVVKGKELRSADLTERMAFFESFGALCGDGGVPFLDGILNGKSGLLGRKEDSEIRACAAMALGHVRTQRAQESLQKAMGEKDVVVRNAVNRALRGGGA
jgi:hypothetical protein